MGRHDIVTTARHPTTPLPPKVALTAGSGGNVTTETLRRFDVRVAAALHHADRTSGRPRAWRCGSGPARVSREPAHADAPVVRVGESDWYPCTSGRLPLTGRASRR
jgi:hypothetical protein